MRGEVADGGQLVVVNKLRLPLRQGELRLGGEVHLVNKTQFRQMAEYQISHTSKILPIFDMCLTGLHAFYSSLTLLDAAS